MYMDEEEEEEEDVVVVEEKKEEGLRWRWRCRPQGIYLI